MDRVDWLQQLIEKRPGDPQVYYWFGKELAESGRWVEAVQAFSAGITHSSDESLRMEIIQELTKASLNMQQEQSSEPEELEKIDNKEEELEIRQFPMELQQTTQLAREPKLKVIDGNSSKTSPKNSEDKVNFEDVAGLEELKKTIRLRIISPFFNKGLFAKFRKKAGGGVLLYGPPGCGKTFIARATAGECKAKFYPIHITDILDPYMGVSEQNLKDIFEKARFQKPSVIFFDEVDTIGFSRSKSSSTSRGLIDTFLTEMDGIDTTTDEILVIAATNTPWDVDQALKRPGRFDRLIFVAPPDEQARENIFRLKLKGRFAEKIDVSKLAVQTEFFSGADIENVVELASENVLGEILTTGIERPLNTGDLLQVLESHQPSTLVWLRTVKNYVKYSNQTGLYNDVETYLKKYGRRI